MNIVWSAYNESNIYNRYMSTVVGQFFLISRVIHYLLIRTIYIFLSFRSQYQVIDCGTSGQWSDITLNTYTSTTSEKPLGKSYEQM